MKAINKIVLIVFQIIFSITIYAQESVQINNKLYSDSDCPVGVPSNPNPPDGTTNIRWNATTLNWTNGTGTTKNEIWFGTQGNLVKIYDGPAITSCEISVLQDSTQYYWFVICKNDSCGTQGPFWTFTTEKRYTTVWDWEDEFDNLNNWTIVGPQGLINWYAFPSSVAGSNAPELRMSWTPSFNGKSLIRSVPISLPYNWPVAYSFFFYLDYFTDPSGTVTVSVTYDGGLTEQILYQLINPTANVGPYFISDLFVTPASGSYNAQLQIWFEGYSFNIDYIYWDRIQLNAWTRDPPYPPENLTAQIIFNFAPQVKLNWQNILLDELGFKIYRKFGSQNDPGYYILIGTVGQNQTQYIDTTVLQGTIYSYQVYAYDEYMQTGSNKVTINVPIPVELISFTAEVEESTVKLFWQTATETNNSGFEVQRSQDYKDKKLSEWISSEQDWEVIGFIAGKGTTTEVQNYSFTDNLSHNLNQVIHYRLKQIDYDGSFKFSSEIEIEIQAPDIFSLEQNYPNPFNPTTKIKYSIPTVTLRQAQSDNWVTLKLYDVLGNEITTLVNERKPAGNYKVEFSGSDLPSGVYFYQLKAGSFIQTKKMILLR
ncbi:MAG: hypothetical protein BWY38_01270 [Ignavibacteria bacterium ADurb.Bin266]|jgi:hypothetical protein|nr:MAG: hypothetical protein BWY38_01270 [Ignavibacteria bacterium ADurb.Bin266]